MNLLITTQKVDVNDKVLGFFHRWIEEFSRHYESVTVLCLEEGKHMLPENVHVLSLGKEKRRSRFLYVLNFYTYIWRERKHYDAVFIHMNPEYAVLGGFLWKIWRKKIALWYNHRSGSFLIRIAVYFADVVFYTSPFSFIANLPKGKKMGAGIDTKYFKRDPNIKRGKDSVLSLGRISAIKNIDVIIGAFLLLDSREISFKVNIYGEPTERDISYYKRIQKLAHPLVKKGIVTFHRGVAHNDTVHIYNQNEIFINMTPSGSFDKTILEAMACEAVVLTCNKSFKGDISNEMLVNECNKEQLAETLAHFLSVNALKKKVLGAGLRDIVVRKHDLNSLVSEITSIMQYA